MSNVKSKAKMVGLKSTLVVGDKTVITSFGKGNTALIEKVIEDGNITDIKDTFSLEIKEKTYELNKGKAKVDNPLFSTKRVGQDLINGKDNLEIRYFGETFNDNIHIQLIYNILDIEKILSSYVNNIIYVINNLRRAGAYDEDLFQNLSTRNTYDVFSNPENILDTKVKNNIQNMYDIFNQFLSNKRLYYFPNVFCNEKYDEEKKNKYYELKDPSDIYYILALLGDLRHFTIHDEKSIMKRNWLYNWENVNRSDINKVKVLDVIERVFNDRVVNIDKSFIKYNLKANFKILFNNFKDESEENLVIDFYNFLMKKEYKNLGFSIKKLRSSILNCDDALMKEKLNRFFDFAIYNHYLKHKEESESFILKLRYSKDEEEKEKLYLDEASRIFKILEVKFNDISNDLKLVETKKLDLSRNKELRERLENALKPHKLSEAKVHNFTKIIYLITCFLNGKEINDLINTLIKKFDNIYSFISVMKSSEVNLDVRFTDEYALFNDSKAIASELRFLLNVAKMDSNVLNAKKVMYRDAAILLGKELTDDEIDSLLNNEKSKNGFRNFLANNVVESSRFKYLIKYIEPEEARKLSQNINVITFVLKDIPEKQIARYYKSLTNSEMKDLKEGRTLIANELIKVNYDMFSKVNNKVNALGKSEESKEKNRLCTLISLYLTVLYLIVKNLVNINSRYTLAFHSLERDAVILGTNIPKSHGIKQWCALTRVHINNTVVPYDDVPNVRKNLSKSQTQSLYRRNRECNYLLVDCNNASESLRQSFRNSIDHLNAVRAVGEYINDLKIVDSYFDIYHYAVQRYTLNKYLATQTLTQTEQKMYDDVLKFKSYSKDLLKALCAPFGYNLPRFKNLTSSSLFDKNRLSEE